MGTDKIVRPARISANVTGDAPRRTFRELGEITQAFEYEAIERGSTLSAMIRDFMREHLEFSEWDVDALISGNPEAVDAAWVIRTGHKRPEHRRRGKRGIPGDPGGTAELF